MKVNEVLKWLELELQGDSMLPLQRSSHQQTRGGLDGSAPFYTIYNLSLVLNLKGKGGKGMQLKQ